MEFVPAKPRLAFLLCCACAAPAASQSMYIYSEIQVNESSGAVTVNASTSTDYNSAYYYDIGVQTSLMVQPQGGSSYNTCQSAASSNSTYASIPPCTINLGTQAATLNLSSFHWLNATYYYYQLQYCTWECYYYDDWYGFSLLGSGGSYSDNQFFYAPGQNVPVAQQTSKSGWIQRTRQKGGCFYPTAETTYPYGWNAYWPYTGQFFQVLGGGSFDDRFVTEVFTGSASDSCWRPQNGGSPLGNPVPGTWLVKYIKALDSYGTGSLFLYTYGNGWGYDHLGFYGSAGSTTLYNYVQNMRPISGTCAVSFSQNMYMFCSGPSGAGQYFRTSVPLNIVISATPSAASLSTSRSGASQVRQYP